MERYGEYKDSGIQWIGEIPSHWDTKRLKYCVLNIREKSLSSDKIGLENIVSYSGEFVETGTKYEGDGIDVRKDDVLYGKLRPYLAKVWLSDRSCNAIGDFYVFRPIQYYLLAGFAKWLFLSDGFTQICSASTYGAKMPRVSYEFMSTLFLPLPPLSEQERIVKFLEGKVLKIDEYIVDKEREIQLLKELKEAEIAKAVTQGLNPNVKMKDSGIPWIGMIPEHWETTKINSVFKERREKVSDKIYPPLSVSKQGITPQLESAVKTDNGDNRKKVNEGDFVVNSRSDRKGSCGISPYTGSVSLINIVLQPRSDIEGKYFHFLFRSNNYIEEYYRIGRGIVADLWTTRYSEMRNIIVPIPPIGEQRAIVTHIESKCVKVNTLITELEAEIEHLKEYKQRLIADCVTGQIKV